MSARWVNAALVLALVSCGDAVATQTFVHLEADDSLDAASTLHIVIWDHEGNIVRDEQFALAGDMVEATLPARVPVSPSGGNPSRTFTLRAALLGADGRDIAVQQVAAGFVEDEARHIVLRFTNACGECPSGERCLGAACVSECAQLGANPGGEPSAVGECGELSMCRSRAPVSVSAGGATACMVDQFGALYCWGEGADGRLGGGTVLGAQAAPIRVVAEVSDAIPTGRLWRQVSVGETHGAAMRGTAAFSWGANTDGQIGNSGASGEPCTAGCLEGRRVGEDLALQRVVAGGRHSLGIAPGGGLYAWGSDLEGQIGVRLGETANAPTPVICHFDDECTELVVVDACAGDLFSCVVTTTGELYCMGDNSRSQLGVLSMSGTIVRVGDSTSWTQVSCGESFACGLQGGELYCWGANDVGQLGIAGERDAPARVGLRDDWAWVSAGADHTCVRSEEGELYCFGDNNDAELGSSGPGGPDMVRVEGTFAIEESASGLIDAGRDFTCAFEVDSQELLCWGKNSEGQLGRGAVSATEAPGAVCFSR